MNKIIPFIISLSFFMEALDSTIINTAIPAMSESLHVYPVDLKIVLISYLLSLAIFIPASGWIADKFGAKQTFLVSLCIFTLSSLWCGFVHHLPELVIARFVQGFGGALGMPVGRLIIIRTFGPQNLIKMMNRVVTTGAIGMMLGPVIGGFLTFYLSWHWIFWVNVPIGCIAILLTHHYLKTSPPTAVPPFDKLGFFLFGSALSGFTLSLSLLSEATVRLSIALSTLLVSLLLFGIYRLHAKQALHPFIKTDLLKIRTFRISVMGNLMSRLGFGGIPFLVPLLLQLVFGHTPHLSGLLVAPIALGVLIVRPFSLPLLRLFGYKRVLIINTCLSGCAIWAFMSIEMETSLYVIALLTFSYGLFLSLQYSALNSLAYADLSEEVLSAGTSIMSTLQQVSQSFGVAMSALFIRLFLFMFPDSFTLTSSVFHHTFFAVGLFTFLSAFIFIQLRPNDGKKLLS